MGVAYMDVHRAAMPVEIRGRHVVAVIVAAAILPARVFMLVALYWSLL